MGVSRDRPCAICELLLNTLLTYRTDPPRDRERMSFRTGKVIGILLTPVPTPQGKDEPGLVRTCPLPGKGVQLSHLLVKEYSVLMSGRTRKGTMSRALWLRTQYGRSTMYRTIDWVLDEVPKTDLTFESSSSRDYEGCGDSQSTEEKRHCNSS